MGLLGVDGRERGLGYKHFAPQINYELRKSLPANSVCSA